MMLKKIGITKQNSEDKFLLDELLSIMRGEEADYTLTFRYLSYQIYNNKFDFRSIYTPSKDLSKWIEKWHIRLKKEDNSLEKIAEIMMQENPAIIPRNHQIGKAIEYAELQDFTKADALIKALANPYNIENEKQNIEFMMPPKHNERVYTTFCGT